MTRKGSPDRAALRLKEVEQTEDKWLAFLGSILKRLFIPVKSDIKSQNRDYAIKGRIAAGTDLKNLDIHLPKPGNGAGDAPGGYCLFSCATAAAVVWKIYGNSEMIQPVALIEERNQGTETLQHNRKTPPAMVRYRR